MYTITNKINVLTSDPVLVSELVPVFMFVTINYSSTGKGWMYEDVTGSSVTGIGN